MTKIVKQILTRFALWLLKLPEVERVLEERFDEQFNDQFEDHFDVRLEAATQFHTIDADDVSGLSRYIENELEDYFRNLQLSADQIDEDELENFIRKILAKIYEEEKEAKETEN